MLRSQGHIEVLQGKKKEKKIIAGYPYYIVLIVTKV